MDFIFYPERKAADGIILELKVDSSPREAIRQIKEKTKEHLCIVEELKPNEAGYSGR